MAKPVKVLVADDSGTARQLLSYVINQTADMQTVGEARDGREAVDMAAELQPDVILMDITMPHMDGLEATRLIMRKSPTPIVVVSASFTGRETEIAFQALRLGALTVMPKPAAPETPAQQAQIDGLVNTLRAMSDVRVIHHRWNGKPPVSNGSATKDLPAVPVSATVSPEITAIVSSTGGPAALSEILRRLPVDVGLPIVIIQHIAADFLPSLVEWLSGVTLLAVKIAEEGEQPQVGTVYFAPGDRHLALTAERRFTSDVQRNTRHVPSGDVLLESVARHYGEQAIGVILTGMGRDGARGLLSMHHAGAVTIAQDEASSVVYGMPCEAVNLNAAQHVLALMEIPGALVRLAKK
jgi:two-component system chemotaxis response regulator CheB